MTPDQRFLAIGIYINSALYLAGVFVAGLVQQNPAAWRLALISAGAAYFAYFAQVLAAESVIAGSLVVLSIVLGAAAGVALFF